MKHDLALMLHMAMIQMFSNTCRSSKHVPSLQIHAYGRLGAKHEHTLPHTSKKGNLCSSLEIIRGPAECSRIMRQQLKAQEGMSTGNFYRSVHRIRSNEEQKKRKISCMVLNAFRVHLSQKCSFSRPIWRTSASCPARLRIRHFL
jgi:hypothetical protein